MYLTGESFYRYDHPNRRTQPFPTKSTHYDLGYWRKHPNLHGYIVQTFAGGEDKCQEIGLSREELGQIIQAIKSRQLPDTTGFFFGESEDSESQVAHHGQRVFFLPEFPGFSRCLAVKKGFF